MNYGSMMIDKPRSAGDDQGLILTEATRDALLSETPEIAPYIRRIFGGDEYINNEARYCLWLENAPPNLLRQNKPLLDRLSKIQEFRKSSNRPQTQRLASTPHLFGEIRQPKNDYILVPKVSSEIRRFIPVGFVCPDVIASGSALVIDNATMFDFGVLTSSLHNSWMRTVCGRMKSDYQYSATLVYNNYPWPENLTDKQKANVEAKAQAVLDARAKYPDSSLADLYDPLTMPPELVKAHEQLDKAVEQCYRSKPFESDRERVEYLFQLYEQLTAPLTAQADKPKRTRKKKTDDAS
jgi:hypothetical protein